MSEIENVIIGAGPAGLAAAAFAPGGALVLEGRDAPGWKILISGGGHCNVTNTFTSEEILRRLGPAGRPMKYALGAFGPEGIRAWLAELGCPTVIRNDWEVYPKSNRAADVLDTLLAAAAANGSEVACGARVTDIKRFGGGFAVSTREGAVHCRRLLIATGTPAWGRPQPIFDEILGRLGHAVRPWVPALCPLRLKDNPFRGLDGISFTGRVGIEGKWREPDEMLITDEGLSGPAALNASAAIFRRFAENAANGFTVDFAPGQSAAETVAALLALRVSHPRATAAAGLAGLLPKRLAERLAKIAGLSEVPSPQLKKSEAERLAALVHSFACAVFEMPSLAKGFVASGGIPLAEVNARTMESRIVRGLFFAGEILDYDAPSGGFNITLALSTGRLAGLNMS
jgi:hypothetical protein